MKLSTLVILAALEKLDGKVDCLMATVQQLKDQVALLTSETAAALDRVATDVAELRRLIADGTATEQDLDSVSDGIANVIASLKSVDPEPSFPAPPPVE